MTTRTTPALVLDGITLDVRDGDATRRLLDGVSLTADAGELVAIVGPSGSGKPTTAPQSSAAPTPARTSTCLPTVRPPPASAAATSASSSSNPTCCPR